MQKDPKDLLSTILSIIGYAEDKDRFISEFFNICYKQAFIALIQKLPYKKQALFKHETDQGEFNKLFTSTFTSKEINQAYADAVKNQFYAYIKKIGPTLSSGQLNKLDNFLQSFNPSQQPQQASRVVQP